MMRQLQQLQPGQRFKIVIDARTTYTGTLIHAGTCRALVELDGTPQERTFKTKDDKTVTLTSSGRKRVNWAPECEVETIDEPKPTAPAKIENAQRGLFD